MTTPARAASIDPAAGRVVTRFGEFDADTGDLLHFPQGLPGFERCRRFVLLSSQDIGPMQCLHAVDGPPASFLVIDPRLVLPTFRCVLRDADRAGLEATDDAPLVWLALLTVAQDGSATVNLRAPIVINPARMIGLQVIPQDSLYPLRHKLAAD